MYTSLNNWHLQKERVKVPSWPVGSVIDDRIAYCEKLEWIKVVIYPEYNGRKPEYALLEYPLLPKFELLIEDFRSDQLKIPSSPKIQT